MKDSPIIIIHHDTNEFDMILMFVMAIKPFGLFLEDLTKENEETLKVRVVDERPEKEWKTGWAI